MNEKLKFEGGLYWIDFTNWKGRRAIREIEPWSLMIEETGMYAGKVILECGMEDKDGARRSIDIASIHGIYKIKPE